MTRAEKLNRLFYFIFAIASAVALTIIGAMSWGDDDVYNFYFQKGGAPQSVVQTGRGQTSGAAEAEKPAVTPAQVAPSAVAQTSPAPSPVTENHAVLAETPTPSNSFKHFSILTGYGQISDSVGTAGVYSLGLQYNFNRYLGVRAAGQFTAAETERPNHALLDSNQAANRYGGYADLVFTPLHIDMLGHPFLEVAGHAGVMSARELSGGAEPYNVNSTVRGFLGASATFNLNDNFGIELFASLADGGKVGRVIASADFRF